MSKYNITNSKTYKSILKKKHILIFFFIVVLYIYLSSGITFKPVEDLGIIAGIGADLYNESSEALQYGVSISTYNYTTSPTTFNLVHTGIGDTIGKTRADRQAKFNKKFIIGLERIVILSEDFSQYSIRPVIDILFSNPNVNDIAPTVVCKGKAEDVLKLSIPGYATSSDYIEGMIEHATDLNFFSDNYKIMDMYVRLDAEGRNIVLPYIEIQNKMPEITGLALFNKDKMVTKIPMDKVKSLNLLRESNVRGQVSIQKNPKEYIDFYATSKRKVKCEKINNKYNFTISLSLIGEVVSNSLYLNMHNDSKVKEKFEEDMSKAVEKICMDFIETMQSEYKVDALELGRVAAATFGRNTGTNWNEVITNNDLTDINVKVNVKVDTMGRGDY